METKLNEEKFRQDMKPYMKDILEGLSKKGISLQINNEKPFICNSIEILLFELDQYKEVKELSVNKLDVIKKPEIDISTLNAVMNKNKAYANIYLLESDNNKIEDINKIFHSMIEDRFCKGRLICWISSKEIDLFTKILMENEKLQEVI